MIPLTHFLNWWIWVKVSLWGSCLLWADLCHLKFICWSPHPLVPQNVTVFWRQGLWRGNSGETRSCGWALLKYDLCPDKRRRLGHKQEKWKSLSRVWLFVTPWTIRSMEFSRPQYWSGQPSPSPGNLPKPGIEPRPPALRADSVPAEPPGKPRQEQRGNTSWRHKAKNSHLQAKERGLRRNHPADTLIPDF